MDSVEADVLEVIILVVVVDRLGERKCLLLAVATLEFHLPHHVELKKENHRESQWHNIMQCYIINQMNGTCAIPVCNYYTHRIAVGEVHTHLFGL